MLRDFIPLLKPTELVIELEKAAIYAFKSEYPTASIKKCFFPFEQTDCRKFQELGLAFEFRKEKDWSKKEIVYCGGSNS